ncbi:hypothetical protein BYT27DRAFT_7258783 [Phlegmacium glaucopus]|nr:hypothetical protein BYT27DRAFT_7258783 [Phlegmacium glaucopus]
MSLRIVSDLYDEEDKLPYTDSENFRGMRIEASSSKSRVSCKISSANSRYLESMVGWRMPKAPAPSKERLWPRAPPARLTSFRGMASFPTALRTLQALPKTRASAKGSQHVDLGAIPSDIDKGGGGGGGVFVPVVLARGAQAQNGEDESESRIFHTQGKES